MSIVIERAGQNPPSFTICTMVNDYDHYTCLRQSLSSAGFDTVSEYIYVDNSSDDVVFPLDFISQCIGGSLAPYLIVCHQDIRFNKDNVQTLIGRLTELGQIDGDWVCCGNAGVTIGNKYSVRISDPYGQNTTIGDFPCRVQSVDENFIVLNKSTMPDLPAVDFGFHYYGTILTLLAANNKKTSYVLDYHVTHLSRGYIDSKFYTEAILWSDWLHKQAIRGTSFTPSCGMLVAKNEVWLNIYKIFCSTRYGKVRFRNLLHKYLNRH